MAIWIRKDNWIGDTPNSDGRSENFFFAQDAENAENIRILLNDYEVDCAMSREDKRHFEYQIRLLTDSIRDLLEIANLAAYYAPGELGEDLGRVQSVIKRAQALSRKNTEDK
jgi:hypothetical protein